MAHPSRLLVIEALERGERCVCELRDLVGADLSTVSKHLRVMREAGLVEHRKDGMNVFYRLRVPCILKFFDCVDAVRAAEHPRARTASFPVQRGQVTPRVQRSAR